MFYQIVHQASPGYLITEKGKDFSYPPHLHQCFELIVLLSGEMQVTVDEKAFNLKEKEGLLVFPNQIHSLQSVKSEHILCIFAPDLVREYFLRLVGKIPQDNSFVPDNYLIGALCTLNNDSATTLKKGVLYSLCAQFDHERRYVVRKAENDGLLNKIFAFVENSFAGDCSLKTLAKNTGYEYAYISRVFKKIVGISYNTYVNHYRISHACYLMKNTDFSIIQCALESGYESVRSFNRNFKLYIGMSPSKYNKITKEIH